jgi:hypothetical protein
VGGDGAVAERQGRTSGLVQCVEFADSTGRKKRPSLG